MDSTFGGLEAIITGLCDEYPNALKRHRELFVAGLVAVIYILSLPTTTYVSIYNISVDQTRYYCVTMKRDVSQARTGLNRGYSIVFNIFGRVSAKCSTSTKF